MIFVVDFFFATCPFCSLTSLFFAFGFSFQTLGSFLYAVSYLFIVMFTLGNNLNPKLEDFTFLSISTCPSYSLFGYIYPITRDHYFIEKYSSFPPPISYLETPFWLLRTHTIKDMKNPSKLIFVASFVFFAILIKSTTAQEVGNSEKIYTIFMLVLPCYCFYFH